LFVLGEQITGCTVTEKWKPKSRLTRDTRTFYFPLICAECGEWHVSIGDMRMHLLYCTCKSVQHNLVCGHCMAVFNNWINFYHHVRVRGMSRVKPYSTQYSWMHSGHY